MAARKQALAPLRDSLFWRSPNYYPTSLLHTLALTAYFTKQAQRLGRELSGSSSAAFQNRGLKKIDIMREPRQNQALNFGLMHLSDREIASRLLDRQDTHRIPVPLLTNQKAFPSYVGLADVAPLLGIPEKWLPSMVQTLGRASSKPVAGFGNESKPLGAEAHKQRQWFEVKLSRRAGASNRRATSQASALEIEVVSNFEGFHALIEQYRDRAVEGRK